MSESERITIPKCPLCEKPHTYPLEIERSYVMRQMLTPDFKIETPKRKYFNKMFTCPNVNEKYEVNFSLLEYSSSPIEDVKVGEPIE